MPVRSMPNAPEAEISLLGTMMVYPSAARIAIEEGLSEEDFYTDSHRRIYRACQELYTSGQPVDLTTVSTRLKDAQLLDTVGGLPYLMTLCDAAVTSSNTKSYVQIIHDKAVMRRLIETADEISRMGMEGQTDINEYLDYAEKTVLDISRDRRTTEFKGTKELMTNVLSYIQKMSENRSGITGLKTSLTDLDNMTHGFQPGDLIILAARPSMGKTAVALNIGLNAALNERSKAVAIFSLEMPAESLGMRLLSARSRVNNSNLRTGRLTNEEWNKVNEAAAELKALKIFIDDIPNIHTAEIFSKCRRLQSEHGLSLVIIDYIQLISGNTRKDGNRQQEVSEISRNLKALARELNVPVIALSQLSRSVEQRGGDKKPMLSDLRESGAIEQDADLVLLLFREAYYSEEKREEAKKSGVQALEINIAKHRNGETGIVNVQFEGNTNAVLSMSHRQEESR